MTKPTTTALLLTAAVMYGIFLYSKKAAAGALRFHFQGIRFKKVSGQLIPSIIVNFKVVNPSSTPIDISSIVGSLIVNGNSIFNVEHTVPLRIPTLNTSLQSIEIQTNLLSALTTILQLVKQQKRLTVTFDGVANTTGYMIPIKETIIQM